jgi:hypothetical protein
MAARKYSGSIDRVQWHSAAIVGGQIQLTVLTPVQQAYMPLAATMDQVGLSDNRSSKHNFR